MVERVSREQNNNITKFQVSETLCLAINNIDYVLKYIEPFVQVKIRANRSRESPPNSQYSCHYHCIIKLLKRKLLLRKASDNLANFSHLKQILAYYEPFI